MNCHWRDGNLYAAHNISSGGLNLARWYHLDTGNWPASGSVSLVQSGNVDGGAATDTPSLNRLAVSSTCRAAHTAAARSPCHAERAALRRS